MRGQTVVLDSTNLEAVIADAQGLPPPELPSETKPEVAETEDKKAEPVKNGKEHKADELDDEISDFAKKLGLSQDQHKAVTETMRKAVNKQFAKRKEAEEFGADQYERVRLAEQRQEKLQREVERLKAQTTPPEVKETGKPIRENFKTDDEYRDAVIDYQVDQRLQTQRQKDHEQIILREVQNRIEKAKSLVPDFVKVIESEPDLEIPPHIAGYMQESDMIAELAYYLAKHPDDVRKFKDMSQAKGLVAIGKIESKLEPFAKTEKVAAKPANGETSPNPKTASEPSPKSRVSEPITPINTASGNQVEKPLEKMSYQEAKADWEKRNGAKLSRRQRH